MANDNDPDNVTRLPVGFREPVDGERLVLKAWEVAASTECRHPRFIVHDEQAEVTCALCKAKLNPIWVLREIAHWERRMADMHSVYAAEMKRLEARRKTKCLHCGEMTPISQR